MRCCLLGQLGEPWCKIPSSRALFSLVYCGFKPCPPSLALSSLYPPSSFLFPCLPWAVTLLPCILSVLTSAQKGTARVVFVVCDAAQPSSVGPGAPPACPCPFYFGLKSQVRMFLSFATVMKSDFSVSVLPAFAEPVSKQRTCCVFVSVVSSFWEEVHTQYRNRKCLRISLGPGCSLLLLPVHSMMEQS